MDPMGNFMEKNLKIRNLQGDSSRFSGKGCENPAESSPKKSGQRCFGAGEGAVYLGIFNESSRIQQLASGNTVTVDGTVASGHLLNST